MHVEESMYRGTPLRCRHMSSIEREREMYARVFVVVM